MADSRHKVLIAIPTWEGHAYCREAFIENTVALAGSHDVYVLWNGGGNPSKIFPKGWKIKTIKDNPRDRGIDVLVRKHNMFRAYMQKHDYTHMFLLESDVLPPPGVIERFLEHDRDMVSAVYMIRGETHTVIEIPDNEKYREKYNGTLAGKTVLAVRDETAPAVWGLEGDEIRFWRLEDMLPQRGLVKAFGAGVGAVLLSREVVDAIPWKVAPEGWAGHADDFPFYHSAHFAGYELFIDTDIIAQHLHDYTLDGAGHEVTHKWFKAKDLEPAGQRSAEHIFT